MTARLTEGARASELCDAKSVRARRSLGASRQHTMMMATGSAAPSRIVMMGSDNNPRIRGLLPPIQPLAQPLPLYKPRFISQEFLRGAKAMADVQHLLFLGSAAARGTAALIVATGSNVFDGLPSRGAGYSSIVHRGEQETKGYLLKLLG